jgi:mannose-1-phosphate guanylyltransferase
MPDLSRNNHRYTVIMAGGVGTRLWPLSRIRKPKQFQSFLSEKTLIQETFIRAQTTVPAEHIFVSTGQRYAALVQEQLPLISSKQLIIEPLAKNTAPAIIYIAAVLAHQDPDALVATLASDHAIENPEEFTRAINLAFETIESNSDALTTIGINPTKPDTNYGYIRMGEEVSQTEQNRVFRIDTFKEKPDRATAEQYLASWEYLWNAGYFIFRAAAVRKWVSEYAPEFLSFADNLSEALTEGTLSNERLMELFSTVQSAPIDTVLAERLPEKKRFVIPTTLEWNDIGGWHTLYTFLSERHLANQIVRGPHIDLASKNCFIHGEKRLIVTAGLRDIVIVDTEDALLVADRETLSQNMKELLLQLPEEKR